MKKLLSLLLSLIMLLSLIPMGTISASGATLTQSQFEAKLNTAEDLYPHGTKKSTWSINGSTVGWDCHGYARWLSWYVWGVDFSNGRGTGWTLYKSTSSSSYIDRLVPGDVVRYRTSTSKTINHSIFITNISGSTIYFTDCNSDGASTIKWGRSVSKSTLNTYLKTSLYNSSNEAASYGYIAHYTPNTLNSKHTLSIKYDANGGSISGSDVKYNKYKVETSAGLHLRSGAGTSYSSLDVIPTNATFAVTTTKTADGYTWGKTTYGGETGWVVISEDWTSKAGTQPATTYYLNSSGLVYKSSSSAVFAQKMVDGTTYDDGLYNCSTFGIARTGYSFKGWGTSSSGGTIYSQSDAMTAKKLYSSISSGDATITLYAIWEPNTLKVYYNSNGASIDSDTYKLSSNLVYKISDGSKYYQTWTYNNTKENGLVDRSTFGIYKTGHTYGGWSTASSGGTIYQCDDATIKPTTLNSNLKNGNCTTTLYAVWNPNKLTVHYKANGGAMKSDDYVLINDYVCNKDDSTIRNHTFTYNVPKQYGLADASSYGLSKTGHKFIGWSTTADASTKIFDQSDASVVATDLTSTIKSKSCTLDMYAVWAPNTLNVHYKANGGMIESKDYLLVDDYICNVSDNSKRVQTWEYNEPEKYGLGDAATYGLKRDGYKFLGWSVSPESTEIFDQSDNTLRPMDITTDIESQDCTIDLYAVWEEVIVETEHVHEWDTEYTIDVEPQCVKAGYKSIHCKYCDEIKDTEELPALEHDYRDTVVKATATEGGYTVHTCRQCGHSYTDNYTDPIATETIIGDTDNDGKVTVLDATCIQMKLAQLSVISYNEAVADTDRDGKISILDATQIQRFLAKLIDTL